MSHPRTPINARSDKLSIGALHPRPKGTHSPKALGRGGRGRAPVPDPVQGPAAAALRRPQAMHGPGPSGPTRTPASRTGEAPRLREGTPSHPSKGRPSEGPRPSLLPHPPCVPIARACPAHPRPERTPRGRRKRFFPEDRCHCPGVCQAVLARAHPRWQPQPGRRRDPRSRVGVPCGRCRPRAAPGGSGGSCPPPRSGRWVSSRENEDDSPSRPGLPAT